MDERTYNRLARSNRGFSRHSLICECDRCREAYDRHNTEVWCACEICQAHNLARNDPYQSDAKGVSKVATINLCERCESMGKSLAMGQLEYRTDPTKGMTILEICPGCVEDFMIWLKSNVDMMSRQKAYKEPWQEDNATEGEIIAKSEMRKVLRELLSGDD